MDGIPNNVRIMSSSAAIDQTTTTTSLMSESSTLYDPDNNVTSFQLDKVNQFPEYIRTTSTLLCVIILVVGIIGNVLVPIVVWRNKDLRSSTNIFLVNLSVADLLVLILCVPTGLVELHSETEVWVLGETMCKIVPFAELSLAHASVLTILAISLERYIAICRPLRANYTCTRKRAAILCIAIWFIGLIATIPVLVIAKQETYIYVYDNSYKPTCIVETKSFWSSVYFLASMVIFFFLPLFILIVIYWIISRNLMSDPCNTAAATRTFCGIEHPNMKARKQVVIMLATVVFFFFICLLPLRILYVYIIVAPPEIMENMGTELYYNILYFSRLMLYANSAINPLLYNVMSSKFREAFFKVLGFSISPQRGRSRWLCRHISRSTFTTNSTTLPNSSVKSTGFNTKMSTRHHQAGSTDSCRLKEITDSPAAKHVTVQVQAQQHAVALRSSSGPYYPTKSILIPKRQVSTDEAAVLTTSHPGNIRIVHKLEPTRANSVV